MCNNNDGNPEIYFFVDQMSRSKLTRWVQHHEVKVDKMGFDIMMSRLQTRPTRLNFGQI